jgi:putative DNA methylase
VLESNGSRMTVRAALAIINQTLTQVLSEPEDAFDSDTQWAIAWFDEHGFDEGPYGEAELLSKAKNTAVGGLRKAGLISSRAGTVRLLRPDELPQEWYPQSDRRFTIWEATHHLLRVYFYAKSGDVASGRLLARLGSNGEVARDLAYRLFNLCEKRRRPQEALGYNALVLGWPELARIAQQERSSGSRQADFFTKDEG